MILASKDALPRLLDQFTAEMHDAVDAVDELLDLRQIGEIGLHETVVAGQIVGLANIAPYDARIDAIEQLAQPRADPAGRAGHQNCLP